MSRKDFVDFKQATSQNFTILRKPDSNGNPLQFKNLRQIKFSAGEPRKMLFKYTHFEKEPFKSININKRTRRPAPFIELDEIPPAFSEPRPISKKKYMDLQHLAQFLEFKYCSFYKNLAHDGKVKSSESSDQPPNTSEEPDWGDDEFYRGLDVYAPDGAL